jgi:hypothetical protein
MSRRQGAVCILERAEWDRKVGASNSSGDQVRSATVDDTGEALLLCRVFGGGSDGRSDGAIRKSMR